MISTGLFLREYNAALKVPIAWFKENKNPLELEIKIEVFNFTDNSCFIPLT
ncbi:MAG: hypothetical protein ACW99L_12725 [Promethearchaeota archaeon]|jgi:hypothetical protein